MAAPEVSGGETPRNKVVYAGKTLIDLTEDTVTPATLKSGVTAHDASGAKITGTLDTTPPKESDINFLRSWPQRPSCRPFPRTMDWSARAGTGRSKTSRTQAVSSISARCILPMTGRQGSTSMWTPRRGTTLF